MKTNNNLLNKLRDNPNLLVVGVGIGTALSSAQIALLHSLNNYEVQVVNAGHRASFLSKVMDRHYDPLLLKQIVVDEEADFSFKELKKERRQTHYKASKFDRLNQMNAANRGF